MNMRIITFSFFFIVSLLSVVPSLFAFEQADIPQRSILVTPVNVAANTGREFTVDVVAFPFVAGFPDRSFQLVNNFKITVKFVPSILRFVRAEERIPFNLNIDEGTGTLVIEGLGKDMYANTYAFEKTPLVRLYFVPLKTSDSTPIVLENFYAINNKGPNGADAQLIDTYQQGIVRVSEGGACVPDCAGKTCGSDGCGGVCGICSQGQFCDSDGTCESFTCTDSDGGKNYNVLGTVSFSGLNYTDYCNTTIILNEYSCTFLLD